MLPCVVRCGEHAREDLRHTAVEGRRAGGRARGVGDGLDPLGRLAARLRPGRRGRDRRRAAPPRRAASACSSTRRSTRSRARRRQIGLTPPPAPRGRGPGVLRRGRPPHRLQGHQGRARGGPAPTSATSSASTPTSTCSTPRRPACAAAAARPGTGACSPRRRSKTPLILSGGLAPTTSPRRSPTSTRGRSTARRAPRLEPGIKDPEKVRALPRDRARRGRPVRMTAVEHRFGPYGGQFVPETLMPALAELEAAWIEARADAGFHADLERLLRDFAGRPTPLYRGARGSRRPSATRSGSSARTCNHTGAHKINNALGQALLARRMGKTRIIAETGAGQHGVATATACALLGLECIVYMGTEDMRRQQPNVQRMGLLGAARRAGRGGGADAQGGGHRRDPRLGRQRRRHALHHRLGRRPGAVPGDRARPPARDRRRGARADPRAGRAAARRAWSPASAAAPTRSGCSCRSSTTPSVAADRRRGRGRGDRDRPPRRAADARRAAAACCTARYSAIMQDEDGQILEAHSISAGLDYPGIGPQHAYLRDTGRATLRGGHRRARRWPRSSTVAELEGIIPALESSHAVAWVLAARRRRELDLDLPLRPRRQGPRRGARGAGRGVSTGLERIAAAFAATDGRAALMPYLMGGFPDLERVAGDRRGLRRRRRRPGRARRAVLRPARRRPGDPRGGHARARRRRHGRRT